MPDYCTVTFQPSGRSATVPEGTSILEAAHQAGVSIPAECGGRGACGKCVVQVLDGDVPTYRIIRREAGGAETLACLTHVHGPLTIRILSAKELPRLITHDTAIGQSPLDAWAPQAMDLKTLVPSSSDDDLGVAVDIGTTTVRLLLVRLKDGVVIGDASTYNPQIGLGADVISRIVRAEKGHLNELSSLVRGAVVHLIEEAAIAAPAMTTDIRAYVISGNLTMIHLLLAEDPSGIRRVPSEPFTLRFSPRTTAGFGWPGSDTAFIHSIPAAGGWVGGDIVAGVVRAGFQNRENVSLYVDLGTNGEIVLGNKDFAMACACSAGPAFEGGGIQCGMRADKGAIDGARIDTEQQRLELSVIGDQAAKGICGSGLISLTDELFRAGWIDRDAKLRDVIPAEFRTEGKLGRAIRLAPEGIVNLYERDLISLIRAKAAVFSGIRTLLNSLGISSSDISEIIVSGNFGRFLNLPAAVGIGLLPNLPPDRYTYINNGSLEGAALSLLSQQFVVELEQYLKKVTYLDLSEMPGYMDEFVAASFLPHTDPTVLRG